MRPVFLPAAFAPIATIPPRCPSHRHATSGPRPPVARYAEPEQDALRVLLPTGWGEQGSLTTLPTSVARHVRARRLREGDTVILRDGQGAQSSATLTTLSQQPVVRVGMTLPTRPTTTIHIRLLVGALASARADWIVEKAVELGVQEVIFFTATRSQRGSASGGREARWKRLAEAACTQCLRATDMEVGTCSWEKVIEMMKCAQMGLVCDVGGLCLAGELIREGLREVVRIGENGTRSEVMLVVGPEGGLCDKEVEMLEEVGGTRVGLNEMRLRAETAAIAAVAVLRSMIEAEMGKEAI